MTLVRRREKEKVKRKREAKKEKEGGVQEKKGELRRHKNKVMMTLVSLLPRLPLSSRSFGILSFAKLRFSLFEKIE